MFRLISAHFSFVCARRDARDSASDRERQAQSTQRRRLLGASIDEGHYLCHQKPPSGKGTRFDKGNEVHSAFIYSFECPKNETLYADDDENRQYQLCTHCAIFPAQLSLGCGSYDNLEFYFA